MTRGFPPCVGEPSLTQRVIQHFSRLIGLPRGSPAFSCPVRRGFKGLHSVHRVGRLLRLIVSFGWFLGFAGQTFQAVDSYQGSVVQEIRFSFTEPYRSKALDQLITQKISTPLDYTKIQESLQALYDTHLFSSLAVDAQPLPNGIILTFQLTPNYFFGDFKLTGDMVLDTSLSNLVKLPLGEVYSQKPIDDIQDKIKRKLEESGYHEALVRPVVQRLEEQKLVEVSYAIQAGPQATLGSYRIMGETALRPETLKKKIKLQTGRPFRRARLEKDLNRLRKLYTSRGFLSAKIDAGNFTYSSQGGTLDFDFLITAGPYIYVDLQGAKISRKKLTDLVPFYDEGSIDRDLIAEGKRKIRDYFQKEGFFDVQVESEDPIAVPEQNAYQVNYQVNKGKKQKVATLDFQGLHHFTEKQIRPLLATQVGDWWHRGSFNEESLRKDGQWLEALYQNAGFQEVAVAPHFEKDSSGQNIDVDFKIQENPLTSIQEVKIEGNHHFSLPELFTALQLPAGTPFSESRLEMAKKALKSRYEDAGFAEVQISMESEDLNPTAVRVRFTIEEGLPYRVGEIHLLGNELTRRKIITRKILLHEGNFFSENKVLQSEQSLYSMGLFSRVNLVPLNVRQPDLEKPVLIRVEESSPLNLAYGIGYENREDYRGLKGVRGTFDLTHNNLFGLARSASFRGTASYRLQQAQLSFKEPSLFNHELEGLALAYIQYERKVSYISLRTNATLQVKKMLKSRDALFFRYSYEIVDLSDQFVNPQATGENLGTLHLSSLSTAWLRDTRDDPLDPTRGFFNSASCLFTSKKIGSQANYVQLFGQTQTYRKLRTGDILAGSFRMGLTFPFGTLSDGSPAVVPITERFFAGGPNTLRGFKLDMAGPLDPETNKPLGGNAQLIGNLELRHSLTQNFILAPFYDVGNVFGLVSDIHLKDFSNTVGLGLRYKTPFGPLRLDIGYNLQPIPGAKNPLFFFTIGNPF
jgi:outer membrane protein insertion porin family